MSSKNEAICTKLYMNGSQFCWCASGCNHHMSGLHLTVSKEWISASKRNARRRSLLLSTWNESKEKSRPAARQIPLTQLTIFAAEGFYFIFSLNWGLFFKTKIRLKLQQRSPSLASVQTCFFITAVLSTSEFHPRSGKKSALGLLTWLIAWGLGASEFIFFCYSALSIA